MHGRRNRRNRIIHRQATDSHHFGSQQVLERRRGASDMESVVERVQPHRQVPKDKPRNLRRLRLTVPREETGCRVERQRQACVSVPHQGDNAGQLHHDLVVRQCRNPRFERVERRTEVLAAHGMEEVGMHGWETVRDESDILAPGGHPFRRDGCRSWLLTTGWTGKDEEEERQQSVRGGDDRTHRYRVLPDSAFMHRPARKGMSAALPTLVR